MGRPHLRGWGLRFALPTLFILLCHELGHYLVCRKHRLPATPPYFVPAPIGLGTFGAFIRIRGPIRTKRQLLEVGVSGPIAGFAALLPFLIYGVAHSRPVPLGALAAPEAPGLQLFLPGQGLLTGAWSGSSTARCRRAPCSTPTPSCSPPGSGCSRPCSTCCRSASSTAGTSSTRRSGGASTGWPGRSGRRWRWSGSLWPGWWLWCCIVLVIGLRHPPLVDEEEPLDPDRRALVLVAALLFALSFMPVPIREVVLALS